MQASTAQSRVYPRVCGGTAGYDGVSDRVKGLSPRVRGNQIVGVVSGGAVGSIPACAGEPRAICRICTLPRVYPRVCGGTAAGMR